MKSKRKKTELALEVGRTSFFFFF